MRPATQGGFPHVSELLDWLACFERSAGVPNPNAQRRARKAWYELEDYLWREELDALKAAWRAQLLAPKTRALELPIARVRRRLERRLADLEEGKDRWATR
jgi:hypothetical protein